MAARSDSTPPEAVEDALERAERALVDGRLELAEHVLRRVLASTPECAEAMWGLGRIGLSTGQPALARDWLQRALVLRDDRAEYHDVLAGALLMLGEGAHAESACRRALALEPRRAGFLCRLGESLRAQERWDEAAAAFAAALECDPRHFRSHTGLGNLERDRLRLDAAERCYLDALRSKPDSALARWNLALLQLYRGDFARGWDGYRAGIEAGQRTRRRFAFPPWDGRPPKQGALLVYAEQGLGDEIMFASCVPDLTAMGVACVLECDPRLGPLFERSFREVTVWAVERDAAETGRGPRAIGAQVACGDLPRFVRREAGAFPLHCGYLHADRAKVDRWRSELGTQCAGLRVGISWRGGARPADREARSVPHAAWRALAEVPGVSLVAAQYDADARDREEFRQAGLRVVWPQALDARVDLDQFAAFLCALDLLVSVDNSTIHLCGALGQRGWLLLPTAADWRWMAVGETSPWYPSLRLFRRERGLEWEGSMGELAAAAARLVNERATQ